MDVEDRRRYFIVGSVILEIVQPLFITRLENDYISKGIGSLQAFLNSLPVIHILFHLRHRNAYCCKDKINCRNNSKLPLIYCQWDMLYTENPGQPGHNCHCKFIANPVRLNELDITLASLILLNCCHLGPYEENAVRKLRRYKNDYLSHNIEGKINETEYKSLWTDLTKFVLQLDQNKQDDLIRIKNRPLDEGLCSRYSTDLLNIHKKLNEMNTEIQKISSSIQTIGLQMQGMTSALQELLSYHRKEDICQYCEKRIIEQGMDEIQIIDLQSILRKRPVLKITYFEMTEDGRMTMCIFPVCIKYICNTDGSQTVVSVNNSALAVTDGLPLGYPCYQHTEIYEFVSQPLTQPYKTVRHRMPLLPNKFILGKLEHLMNVIEPHPFLWGKFKPIFLFLGHLLLTVEIVRPEYSLKYFPLDVKQPTINQKHQK